MVKMKKIIRKGIINELAAIIYSVFILTILLVISSCVGFTFYIYSERMGVAGYRTIFASCAISIIAFVLLISYPIWVEELKILAKKNKNLKK